MAYKRKTADEYAIEQYTGPQYKWEEVTVEETSAAARQTRKEYRENQPEYPVRIRKRRVKLTPQE